jgi:uncharacterized protein (DUF488 family)
MLDARESRKMAGRYPEEMRFRDADPKTGEDNVLTAKNDADHGEATTTICAIGHSTTPIDRFLKVLLAHSITTLVDIRLIPRSRHNPQFDSKALEKSLKGAGIDYVHLRELGGLRHPSKYSENTGWKNLSFRGYADYMQTEEFSSALDRLVALSKEGRVAIVCAEGNPYRCHRSLVADALTVRGIRAVHISSAKPGRLHTLTAFAHATGKKITYGATPTIQAASRRKS